MIEKYDLVVRNARIRSFPNKKLDIAVNNGVIAKIGSNLAKGEEEINAQGKLVTESFVNAHIHMCKVYTMKMVGEEALKLYQSSTMSKAALAIEIASKVKEKHREEQIYRNAKKALMLGLKHGVLYYRAFVDVDTKAKLKGVKALLKLKKEFQDVCTIQVVAFPQDGVEKDPGTEKYVKEAVEAGAEVVGGIPWIEDTEEDMQKHIDKMFEIAKEYGKNVAMLTDDTGDPTFKTTEMLAVKTLKEEWVGKVSVHHARAMQVYPNAYFQRLMNLLKKAKIGVVSDPHTGPLHAKVKQLLQAGVNVALGQDDITDAYYPYGQNNMLEIAFLASHILWATTIKDMETLYDMVTRYPAEILCIPRYGLKKGNIANLVVLNAETVWEALQYHEPPQFVISKGKVVVENKTETKYNL